MDRVGEHPIPAGPLAVRWLGYRLPEFRAGAESVAEVVLQNAGTATWRQRRELGVKLSYHWLDDRGNAIVWDGPRVDFGGPVLPGDEVEVELLVRAPQPPGRYRLAFDLVEELRFWFAEVGSHALELDAEVLPRIDDPMQRQPDITRAKGLLGWEPEVSLEEGLSRLLRAVGVEPVAV